jgi:hypothetical protein
MELTIKIKDEKADELLNIICKNNGYQWRVVKDKKEVANPQTRKEFVEAYLLRILSDDYRASKEIKAKEEAVKNINNLED